jgi:hypothetical protein
MQIKFNVTFLPKKNEDLNSLLLEINKKFEDSFAVNGKFISSKESLVNLDDNNIKELRSFSKEKSLHLISSWISDDVGEAGATFYNSEKDDEYSLKSNLGSADINIVSFLVLCGASTYLSEVLF